MKEVELEIGGQMIDRYYGHYHSAQSKLRQSNPTRAEVTAFNRMSGNCAGVSLADSGDYQGRGWKVGADSSVDFLEGKFFIPLYFWFCCNVGLSLPLIALQYHEVKVNLKFESISNLGSHDSNGGSGGGTITELQPSNVNTRDFKLWVDYIYLDTDERRRFAQVSHEYLIEQLQFETASEATGGGTTGWSHTMSFNHPVKELIFNIGKKTTENNTPHTTNDADVSDPLPVEHIKASHLLLKLNGHDRFAKRDIKYFTRVQVLQHHSGHSNNDSIGVYSFALKPEEHQPSGTCNFSRIDNAILEAEGSQQDPGYPFYIYAVNYNVLRIMSGMGGLAYSN
jgi:hypothetical protein